MSFSNLGVTPHPLEAPFSLVGSMEHSSCHCLQLLCTLGILDPSRGLGSGHLHAWCILLPVVARAQLHHAGVWLRLSTGFLVPSPATWLCCTKHRSSGPQKNSRYGMALCPFAPAVGGEGPALPTDMMMLCFQHAGLGVCHFPLKTTPTFLC